MYGCVEVTFELTPEVFCRKVWEMSIPGRRNSRAKIQRRKDWLVGRWCDTAWMRGDWYEKRLESYSRARALQAIVKRLEFIIKRNGKPREIFKKNNDMIICTFLNDH